MATRGFEFAGNINGQNSVPVIRDLPVDGTGAYKVGDVVLLNSDGQGAKVTGSAKEVTGVIQERRASGSDGGLLKIAILNPTQIWRCSMDATSTSAKVGFTKTLDVADENTLDADDLTNGTLTLWDTDVDGDGNILAYVIFNSTTFGPGPGQVAYEAALALKAAA
jgi:hypothetical protein